MRNMGTLILIPVLILALLLGGCACAAAEEAPATSVEMTRRMGNGINLGNTMEACNNGKSGGMTTDNPKFYETYWGQPVTTPEMLKAMKEAGFDTIRIPVAWMTNATRLSEGDWTISPKYLDRVEEIVNYALDADMIVIINDHWDGGWWGMFGSDTQEKRELAMEAYTGMWKQIAERFGRYDWHVIFESANEELGSNFDMNSPLYCEDSLDHKLPDNERYALTNRVNQVFVDTVRAAGGNNADRFLLIAGYNTDIDHTTDPRFQMPKDTAQSRLLLSVHYYNPWSYCGASSAKGATLWGRKKDFEDMYAMLGRMRKFTAAGYGVVIGEYGAMPGSDGLMKANAPAYHEAFLNCCVVLDMTSCLWDCSGSRRWRRSTPEGTMLPRRERTMRKSRKPARLPLTRSWKPRRKAWWTTAWTRVTAAAWPGSCSTAVTGRSATASGTSIRRIPLPPGSFRRMCRSRAPAPIPSPWTLPGRRRDMPPIQPSAPSGYQTANRISRGTAFTSPR